MFFWLASRLGNGCKSGRTVGLYCGILVIAQLLVVSSASVVAAEATADLSTVSSSQCIAFANNDATVVSSPVLRVITLNVAHGRKDRMNQALLRSKTIRANLSEVASFLNTLKGDVIGLQEADAPSRWSGRFDHVALLSSQTAKPCVVHGTHATGRWYNFGTALLSAQPFAAILAHDFAPSKPTTTKGFVLGTIQWNPDYLLAEPVEVSLVSVHLDFSRESVRASQVGEMISILKEIDGPLVIMGDFNTDWISEDSALRVLSEGLGMHAFEADNNNYSTYHSKDSRLDWILLSGELRFKKHVVMPDVVSDHRAVVADIGLMQ